MSPLLNGFLAAVVIGGAAFLGQSPGIDQPTPATPAAVVDQPSDDGCDHPTISRGDYQPTPAELEKLTRMAIAQCRAVDRVLGSRSGDGPPTDDEMCDVVRQVAGDPTATCHHSQ